MIQLFSAGGTFMLPMLLLFLVMLVFAARTWMLVFSENQGEPQSERFNFIVLQIGIFSFFLGLFSQILGLMQAFKVIQEVGGVSPELLAGGLYVSLIAPSFGLIILLVSLVSWSGCKYKMKH